MDPQNPRVEGQLNDPCVQMMTLLLGSLSTQLLAACAELGVADAMDEDQPRPVEELAHATDAEPDALYRALRALAGMGLFREETPRAFTLTPLGATLRTGAAGSLREMARSLRRPEREHAYAGLFHTLRTGEPAFDHVFGTDLWSHLFADKEASQAFNAAMADVARNFHGPALQGYDLSDVKRLVDVGGGKGELVASALARHPEMQAVIFDQPHVVETPPAAPARAGVQDRVQLVGGDFFESVPAGGDVYVLSWILCDWDDRDAIRILTRIREAMHADSRLLVLGSVVPEDGSAHMAKWIDVMGLALRGRERTEAELAALFQAARLRLVEVRTTAYPTSVVVATPVA